jgi:hypothetical protein
VICVVELPQSVVGRIGQSFSFRSRRSTRPGLNSTPPRGLSSSPARRIPMAIRFFDEDSVRVALEAHGAQLIGAIGVKPAADGTESPKPPSKGG